VKSIRYVIARTPSSRPTLMHAVSLTDLELTRCGLDTSGWSRAYTGQPVPQILCKRCGVVPIRASELHRR